MTRLFPIGCVLLLAQIAWTQVMPVQAAVGVNRPIPILIETPGDGAVSIELLLFDARGAEVGRAPINAPGIHNLAELFPAIWTDPDFGLVYVQAVVEGVHRGPPLVLEPLDAPARATDGLSARLDEGAIPVRELARLPEAKLDELREQTVFRQASPRIRSGVRLWIDRRIVLDTDAGEVELALRPDAAPNTCAHFLGLVESGFLESMPFHRVINADANGRPFIIQSGDPTGTGAGGAGRAIDLEASTLAHDFGVVSMARKPDDPNSASSQFFICLSREACASLDGHYAAFAQVVRGEDAIATIAATPTGAGGRPIDPPMLLRAYTIDAPTMDERVIEAPAAPVQTKPGPR